MSFLIGSFIFSSIGFVAFVYGKKQGLWKTAFLGVLLMGYSYFVPDAFYVYVIGAILTVALFVFKD